MHISAELRCALAVCAAIVGAGFASGHEIMVFFSEMGSSSWTGITAACLIAGCTVSAILYLGRKTASKSLPELCGIFAGAFSKNVLHTIYGFLMLCTAAIMLSAGSELGELALPVKRSDLFGMAAVLLPGIFASRKNSLAKLGALLVPLILLFYLAMALDPRPVDTSVYLKTTRSVRSGIPLALLLGAAYAAINVSFAGSVLLTHTDASPVKTGFYAALMLFLMLIPANAVMLSHFESLLGTALPSILLAARWGTAGYYAAILVMYVSVVSTLGAAFSSLRTQFGSAFPRWSFPAAAVLFSFFGFGPLIRIVYPLLGWTCALALFLFLLYPAKNASKMRVKFRTKHDIH